MAMSARVNRMNGRIIGEKRGGVMRRFSHDPQGNTVAVYNTSGTQTDSFVYWPYGEVRVRTGTSTIPYQYSGAWGSYTDSSGRNYNVYRYLRKDFGRWMTVDRTTFRLNQYAYKPENLSRRPPSVNVRLEVSQCYGECWGPFGCFCSYTCEYQFSLRVTTNGAKNCRIWQWVSEPGTGNYQWKQDRGKGWPYPWERIGSLGCDGPHCETYDLPGISGHGYCKSDYYDHRAFITCLECDNYCECWYWEINTKVTDCVNTKCTPYGPVPASTKTCPVLSTQSPAPGSQGGGGGPVRYP